MIRTIARGLAVASLAFVAVPAIAQDAEEPRTTYSITFLKFDGDGADKWAELNDKYWAPAAKAAGLPVETVHWMLDGDYDLMVVREIPRGMAAYDTHNSPERKAWREAYVKLVGGEDAVKKLEADNAGLVKDSKRFFSHTHP